MKVASSELVAAWTLAGAVAAILTSRAVRCREHAANPWHLSAQILITAALFAALAWRLGPTAILLAPSWLAATGVALAATDLRIRKLPNRLVLPNYLAIPGLGAVTTLSGTESSGLIRAILGMAAVLSFYGLLYVVFPGQFGGGDLKLAGPIGFLLAWQSWNALLTATLLTWLLAALALPLSTTNSVRNGDPSLPLGPFLIGASLAVTLLLPWDSQHGAPSMTGIVAPQPVEKFTLTSVAHQSVEVSGSSERAGWPSSCLTDSQHIQCRRLQIQRG